MSEYWIKLYMVEADNYGDTYWNYYYELYNGKSLVWTDYTAEEPSLKKIIEEQLERTAK